MGRRLYNISYRDCMLLASSLAFFLEIFLRRLTDDTALQRKKVQRKVPSIFHVAWSFDNLCQLIYRVLRQDRNSRKLLSPLQFKARQRMSNSRDNFHLNRLRCATYSFTLSLLCSQKAKEPHVE
jgi:hypothetical protein